MGPVEANDMSKKSKSCCLIPLIIFIILGILSYQTCVFSGVNTLTVFYKYDISSQFKEAFGFSHKGKYITSIAVDASFDGYDMLALIKFNEKTKAKLIEFKREREINSFYDYNSRIAMRQIVTSYNEYCVSHGIPEGNRAEELQQMFRTYASNKNSFFVPFRYRKLEEDEWGTREFICIGFLVLLDENKIIYIHSSLKS